jgi:hypothetical protein
MKTLNPIIFAAAYLCCLPANADDLWRPERLTLVNQIDRAGRVTKNVSDILEVGASASKSDTVATESTRALVIFNDQNPHAIMLEDTALSLGESCIELDRGRTLIVGKTCISIADRQGDASSFVSTQSSVIIEKLPNGEYTIKTLAGRAVVGPKPIPVEINPALINQYPKVNTSLGIDLSGYGYAYPSSGGLIIGSLSNFVPLAQKRQKSILYSFTSAGTNLDGYWGASTEVGYRWFSPSNKSTSAVYLGYSGFESPSCFSNSVNLGGQWERARWRIGATTGLNAGGCKAGFSFGSLNVSAPVAKISNSRSAYLSLTPYVLWGDNTISPFNYNDSGSSVSPGARLSLSVPVSERLSFDTYSGIDTVYGVMVGGRFNYRFPFGKGVVTDPNIQGNKDKEPASGSHSQPQLTQHDPYIVVDESYKATFTRTGSLVGPVTKIPSQEMAASIKEYMEGIEPLPESNRIASVAASNNALTTSVAGILGVYYLESASLPASRTAQQPFDVNTVFPTAAYGCVATGEAKTYAEQRLRQDGKDAAADRVAAANIVYLGKGDKVSNGWNVTTSPSRAFRMANGATCSTINSNINNNSNYDGPRNPLSTQVIK